MPYQPPDAPIINIAGAQVALGPMRRDLQPLILRWLNDFDVLRTFSGRLRPLTVEEALATYDRVGSSERDVVFTLYERDSLRPIGYAGLYGVDHAHRTAELTVLIGEKDCWGRGYGTETMRLLLDYGFTALGLHSILARVYSHNARSLRAATRAGFREVGRWREAHWRGGQAYDFIFLDCLANEFESPVLHRLLTERGDRP